MEPKTNRKPRILIPGIDLVRFCAAVFVVFFHYAYWSWNDKLYPTGIRAVVDHPTTYPELIPFSWWGWVGVEVFFVISGFLIAISAEGRTPNQFFRARLLRLAPALWFFATLALVVTFIYAQLSTGETLLYYINSIILFPKGPWLDGVYWTLTVEITFYGMIFMLLYAKRPDLLIPITFIWGAISSLFWIACFIDNWGVFPESISTILETLRMRYFPKILLLTTGPYFVLGLMIYLIYRQGMTPARLTLAATAMFAGEVGIYHTAILVNITGSAFVPCFVWTIAVAFIVGSIMFGQKISETCSPRTLAFIRNLGLTTYPLYLFHNISGGFVFGHILGLGINRFAGLIIALALAIGVSYVFAVYLERPLRNRIATAYDAIYSALQKLLNRTKMQPQIPSE